MQEEMPNWWGQRTKKIIYIYRERERDAIYSVCSKYNMT